MILPSALPASLLVALGGGTGAVLRFQLGRMVGKYFPAAATAFPFATLAANVIGSLCMGILVGWLARHGATKGIGAEGWRLLLGVGMLGGFTTFSSFSMEIVLLWDRGAAGLAITYAAISLAAGVIGMVLGLMLMRAVG